MSDMRSKLFIKYRRQLISLVFTMIFISFVHSASFSRVRRKTSFLRYEWCENLTPQKVQEATHTSCFPMTLMPFVHSASLSLVRRPTSVLRDEWRENSIFHKVPEITHTFCKFRFCRMHNLFQDHFKSTYFILHVLAWYDCERNQAQLKTRRSWNRPFYENFANGSAFWILRLVRRKTKFLCHEWREHLTLHKVPETTHTSCFTMTFMSFWSFWEVKSCTTPNNYSPLWVTWELNFSGCAGDNSYLLFYHNFDVSCTFSKFNSCRTHDQFSPLWVTGEFDFSGFPKDKSYLLFHDECNALITFWKFEPSTMKDNFCPLRVTLELSF